jgi:DNA-directed RNA polymerase specialized sigma24 family protein
VTAYGDRSDQQLTDLARSGDRSAFAVLFLRHAPRIHDLVRRATDDAGRADHVTVEAFRTAIRDLTGPEDPAMVALRHARAQLPPADGAPVRVDPSVPAFTDDLADDLWRRVASRWPADITPQRRRTLLRALAAAAALAATAGALVVVGVQVADGDLAPQTRATLTAVPYDDASIAEPSARP